MAITEIEKLEAHPKDLGPSGHSEDIDNGSRYPYLAVKRADLAAALQSIQEAVVLGCNDQREFRLQVVSPPDSSDVVFIR